MDINTNSNQITDTLQSQQNAQGTQEFISPFDTTQPVMFDLGLETPGLTETNASGTSEFTGTEVQQTSETQGFTCTEIQQTSETQSIAIPQMSNTYQQLKTTSQSSVSPQSQMPEATSQSPVSPQPNIGNTSPTQSVSSVSPAPSSLSASSENPIAVIMVKGDSHLDANNYGQHVDYSKETLYYEEVLTGIAKEEGVTHYIDTGDLVMKKDFSLEYRSKVDKILTERRDLMRSRGGDMIYLRGNHDYSLHNITEYDYYANRDIFTPAKKCPVLDFHNSTGAVQLHIELKDWQDMTPVSLSGLHNILITHGLFTSSHVEGETMPNYGTAIDLTDKKDWAGIEYLLCGHIHTEHIQQMRIGGSNEMTIVHYLPCLSRPQYIKKYEEGENRRTSGNIDLIRVYEDGHIEVEAYAVDFLDNRLCFNIERIANEQAKLEMSIGDQSRREALKNMAEELQQYENREVDPVEQVKALGNVDELYKKIVISWFEEADTQLQKTVS